MEKIFFDTGGIVAVLNKSDQFHKQAHLILEELKATKGGVILITTDYVLDELCSKFAKVSLRRTAVEFIDWFRSGKTRKVISVDEPLFLQAFEDYRSHVDKEWSLTDCISFIVMRREGITKAFATDSDFEQAGFTRLIK
jgi:predicted nucleic acid-binding protein